MSEDSKNVEKRIPTEAGRIRARIYSTAVSTMPPRRIVSTVPPHQPGDRPSLAKALSPYKNK